ncbi:MAG: hypothetical protein NW207_12540 [Cytophagales bacterium]|nr:hypothetical protein [Cytophagales bacterium]
MEEKERKKIDISLLGQNIDTYLQEFYYKLPNSEEDDESYIVHANTVHKLDSYDNYSMRFK